MRISSSAPSKILFTRGSPNSPLPSADLEELDLNDDDDQKTNTEDDDELLEIEKEREEEQDEADKDDSIHPDKSE